MKSLALFLVSFLLFACESSVNRDLENAPLISFVYTDDAGRELHFESEPRKLISLAPSITEMIYFLEAEDCLLATSQACNYPPETLSKTKVYTYPELDTETILSLQPDLILATNEIFSPEVGTWFHQYQIPVLFQQYKRLDDIFRNMEALTQLIACKPISSDKIASLRRVCDSIQTRHKHAVRHKVMILVNSAPLCIAGKTSFMHDLITTAGGQNIGEHLNQAYPEVTSEFLLQQNPDFILLPAKDEASALEFIIKHPELNSLKAISEKRLILVNPDIYLRPGPRSVDALIELATLLHPGE